MRISPTVWCVAFAIASLLTACGAAVTSAGAGRSVGGPLAASCPPAPGAPTPAPAWLNFPPNGSTGVATSIGVLIETGAEEPAASSAITITVTSPSGQAVALGTPTSAPSPLPTPFATSPPAYYQQYVAIPLPTLAHNTTYTVSDEFAEWSNNPPQCSTTVTQSVGSFSTGSQ